MSSQSRVFPFSLGLSIIRVARRGVLPIAVGLIVVLAACGDGTTTVPTASETASPEPGHRDPDENDGSGENDGAGENGTGQDNDSGENGTGEGDAIALECDELVPTSDISAVLGLSFGPVERVPVNTCVWTAEGSSLAITVWGPESGPYVQAQMDANPDWHVIGVGDAAFLDPATSANPSGIEGDDGTMQWSAHVNFQFLTDGTWILLQPSGNVVVETDIAASVKTLAEIIHQSR